ncbi:MAG: tyrosine-type recombinase/integrase, partial [Chromatiales bacterium]|nr:tyrosine-type recombinase/integrase [Chromatiales bacterium]
MASIQERRAKDGTVHYRVQIRLKGHPVLRQTFRRKTDAKLWAQQMEADIRKGRAVPTNEARRRTLGELIDRYIATVLPTKPKSEKKQTALLGWWRQHYGSRVLSTITPSVLAGGRDRLASEETVRGTKRSPATVVRYMAALSVALSIAVTEWEWLESNPMKKVRRPTEPRGRVRFLDEDECDRLLQACRESRSPHLYPAVLLAVSTGMRRGEVLGLRWLNVELKIGRITIH